MKTLLIVSLILQALSVVLMFLFRPTPGRVVAGVLTAGFLLGSTPLVITAAVLGGIQIVAIITK